MRDELRNKCDLFAENYRMISKSNRWNYSTNNRLGALLYTMESKTADLEAIRSCKRIIKQNSGAFSRFRDITLFMTAVILSLKEEPEKLFRSTEAIYKEMKQEGLHSSVYLVLAALFVAVQAEPQDYNRIIGLTKTYYASMKKEHRLLTGTSDYGYATLLAMSDKSVSVTTRDMETCYGILMEHFTYRNPVQSLSHVLAFSDQDALMKCQRVIDLYEELRHQGIRFGTRLELPVLGVTALLMGDTRETAKDIAAVQEYLSHKRGFGMWLPKKERLVYAAVLVSDDYAEGLKSNTMELSLANSITGILLAQQMAVVAASSAAAASAASSGS